MLPRASGNLISTVWGASHALRPRCYVHSLVDPHGWVWSASLGRHGDEHDGPRHLARIMGSEIVHIHLGQHAQHGCHLPALAHSGPMLWRGRKEKRRGKCAVCSKIGEIAPINEMCPVKTIYANASPPLIINVVIGLSRVVPVGAGASCPRKRSGVMLRLPNDPECHPRQALHRAARSTPIVTDAHQ